MGTNAGVNWAEIPDYPEKYQQYLAIREWNLLREAVTKRSSGVCERCRHNPMDHVHHLTYARKYHERLDDLQAICLGCHEFTHAKSNTDPLDAIPVMFRNAVVSSVYLAGKITVDSWRDQIAPGWSHENHGIADDGWHKSPRGELSGTWQTVPDVVCVPHRKKMLGLTGPWWRPLDSSGGHGICEWNTFDHACGRETGSTIRVPDPHTGEMRIQQWGTPGYEALMRSSVLCNIQHSIERCDLLFAWIDSLDCFGTLAEIGMARRAGKPIVIGTPSTFDSHDLWLAFQMAAVRVVVPGGIENPARAAWNQTWLEHA